jgi:hypothetical protein
MQWGRSGYISMFPWWSHGKIFGQEGSRKFQDTRREGTQIGKIQKNKKERMEERRRGDVFSIAWDCPFVTLLAGEPLVWESPLQHNFY